MSDSPTSRSLAWCRQQGYDAAVTERWNPYAKIRQDLFGVLDLIVLDGERVIGVQTSVGARHADKRAKIEAAPVLPRWYAAGAVMEVWTWSKTNDRQRGKRKTWSLRRERLSLPNHWTEIEDDNANTAPLA